MLEVEVEQYFLRDQTVLEELAVAVQEHMVAVPQFQVLQTQAAGVVGMVRQVEEVQVQAAPVS